MSAPLAPRPTKTRPSRPRVCQPTSEPGPPDLAPLVGTATSSGVPVSATARDSSIAVIRLFHRIPLSTSTLRTTTSTSAVALAARAPMWAASHPDSRRYPARTARPAATSRTKRSPATTGITSAANGLWGVVATSSCACRCHRWPMIRQINKARTATPAKISHDRRVGSRGSRSANSRQIQAPRTPRP